MAYASIADLAAFQRRVLDPDERVQAQACLDAATAIIDARTYRTFTDPVPSVVSIVCVSVATRMFQRGVGVGVRQESLGGYSASYDVPDGLTLTRAEERLLQRYSLAAAGSHTLTQDWTL